MDCQVHREETRNAPDDRVMLAAARSRWPCRPSRRRSSSRLRPVERQAVPRGSRPQGDNPQNRHRRAATRGPRPATATADGQAPRRSQSRRRHARTRAPRPRRAATSDQPRQHGDREAAARLQQLLLLPAPSTIRTATARSGSATSTTTRTAGIRGYYGYGSGYGAGYGAGYGSGFGFDIGELRLQVTPRHAQVFVDGYYAGTVDDYDGTFQALKLEAGPYHIRDRRARLRDDLIVRRADQPGSEDQLPGRSATRGRDHDGAASDSLTP